jgi:hypothetical protein
MKKKRLVDTSALVVTYKIGCTGDVPVTNGLIKGIGLIKHIRLKEENKDWVRALVPSNATHHE